jgi:hypothetical protein
LEDVPAALEQIVAVVRPGGAYVLEYANKRHLKAIIRYLVGRQAWSPFAPDPYEFIALNYDFHPAWIGRQLRQAGLMTDAELAVSHFRLPLLKRILPPRVLAEMDGVLQGVGAYWKLTPSVFVRAHKAGAGDVAEDLFRCPRCGAVGLARRPAALACERCQALWAIDDGIYDFKAPVGGALEAKRVTSNPAHVSA